MIWNLICQPWEKKTPKIPLKDLASYTLMHIAMMKSLELFSITKNIFIIFIIATGAILFSIL